MRSLVLVACVAVAIGAPVISLDLDAEDRTPAGLYNLDTSYHIANPGSTPYRSYPALKAKMSTVSQKKPKSWPAHPTYKRAYSQSKFAKKCEAPVAHPDQTCKLPHAKAYDHHDGSVEVSTSLYLVNNGIITDPIDQCNECDAGQAERKINWRHRAEYLMKFDAKDSSGNQAEQVIFALILDDMTAPNIQLCANLGKNLGGRAPYTVGTSQVPKSLIKLEACDRDNIGQQAEDRQYWVLCHDNRAIDAVDGRLDRDVVLEVENSKGTKVHDYKQGSLGADDMIRIDTHFQHSGRSKVPTPSPYDSRAPAKTVIHSTLSHATEKSTIYISVSDKAGMFGKGGMNNVHKWSTELIVKDTTPPIIYCKKGTCAMDKAGHYSDGIKIAEKNLIGSFESCCTMCEDQQWTRAVGSKTAEAEACTHFAYSTKFHTCRLFSGLHSSDKEARKDRRFSKKTGGGEWGGKSGKSSKYLHNLKVDGDFQGGRPMQCDSSTSGGSRSSDNECDNTSSGHVKASADPGARCIDFHDSLVRTAGGDKSLTLSDTALHIHSKCVCDGETACDCDMISLSEIGSHKVQYTCSDLEENQAEMEHRSIVVKDSTPPILQKGPGNDEEEVCIKDANKRVLELMTNGICTDTCNGELIQTQKLYKDTCPGEFRVFDEVRIICTLSSACTFLQHCFQSFRSLSYHLALSDSLLPPFSLRFFSCQAKGTAWVGNGGDSREEITDITTTVSAT
jgi:hypothetical protein